MAIGLDLQLYLEEDFLKNPEPFIKNLDAMPDLEACQAEISMKLDDIESQLMSEVARQSAVFFSTLSVIQEIKDSLSGLSSATHQVSLQIQRFEEGLLAHQADLQDLYRQQENLQKLQEDLDGIDRILKTRIKIHQLVNECSFEEALFLIGKVEGEIRRDFPEFGPFKEVMADLGEMRLALEKMNQTPIAPSALS